MTYKIEVHSQAWGIDPQAVRAAFRTLIRDLDQATATADDDGSPVEGSLVISGWTGDDSSDRDLAVTAADVRSEETSS